MRHEAKYYQPQEIIYHLDPESPRPPFTPAETQQIRSISISNGTLIYLLNNIRTSSETPLRQRFPNVQRLFLNEGAMDIMRGLGHYLITVGLHDIPDHSDGLVMLYWHETENVVQTVHAPFVPF